jgi:hypothetical protein
METKHPNFLIYASKILLIKKKVGETVQQSKHGQFGRQVQFQCLKMTKIN